MSVLTPLTLTVESRRDVADGVVQLDLVDETGNQLPAWDAGAHIDLRLGEDLVRQYSLCGDPHDRSRLRVAVLLEPESRGGSRAVHETLRAGSRVDVGLPRNHFPLKPAPKYLFIAGGVGITPLRSMILEVERAGAEWQLVYGGRSRSTMAFVEELEQDYPSCVTVRPAAEYGLLDLDVLLALPRGDTLVYCCGPEPLIEAVESLTARWPRGSLHVERFVPRPADDSLVDQAFEVEFRRSGVTAEVPADQSIIDVAEANGVFVLYSCREGTCGTCETPVLEGVPEHRDSVLADEQRARNATMMICVGRCAGGRLVLDA